MIIEGVAVDATVIDDVAHGDLFKRLFGGKRSDAGFLAPAQGLCLMEVTY